MGKGEFKRDLIKNEEARQKMDIILANVQQYLDDLKREAAKDGDGWTTMDREATRQCIREIGKVIEQYMGNIVTTRKSNEGADLMADSMQKEFTGNVLDSVVNGFRV